MTLDQLVERVSEWSLGQRDQSIARSLFEDLIDDGLISGGEREDNRGIRPVYNFDCRSYRRALQIVRLRNRGIIGRDAIRVHLFIGEYSLPAWDVREPLRNEYVKLLKTISSQIRSRHANSWNELQSKPDQKASFVKQGGELDPNLLAAGLKLADDLQIKIIRNARQLPMVPLPETLARAHDMLLSNKANFEQLAKQMAGVFSGQMMFQADRKISDADITELSHWIASREDDAFIRARRLYRLISRDRFRLFWNALGSDGSLENQKRASIAALSAIRHQTTFAIAALVQCLQLQELPQLSGWLSSDENCLNLLSLLDSFYGEPRQSI